MSRPLWQPSRDRIEQSNLTAFMRTVGEKYGKDFSTYDALHAWSIAEPEIFWQEIWELGEVRAQTRGGTVLEKSDTMPGARFFPDARLNFAENLLRRRDETIALHFNEEGTTLASWSWRMLYDDVSRLAQVLKDKGVGPGDRVAAIMPNRPETLAAMLACASIGAIWSSCSPDFGVRGVVDRFAQIEPKVLFTCDGYRYQGKLFPMAEKLAEIGKALPGLSSMIIVPFSGVPCDTEGAESLPALLNRYTPGEIAFAQLPFAHPLYIMFSSGTTGYPKCIVHSAGGTLLQHIKEHRLHCDIKPDTTVFYYTTCGWMMWNWLVSALACEARLALYDGSPFYPDGDVLFDYIDTAGINVFGVSAKFIDTLRNRGLSPGKNHNLSTVRSILSTGSALAAEGFDYVYENIRQDVALASISGGTDILSCFVLANPAGAIWRGEIQARGLGMAVEVRDSQGRSVTGEKGELVCTRPFPSMPVRFWNDANGEKYHNAYFNVYPDVWHHGDFAQITDNGGFIIHGRSDATLNPGGVRIGTAEIYAQVENLPEVAESVAIGQEWEDDTRIILFVVLNQGFSLTDALIQKIRTTIRTGASPRHVPAKVIAVADIPRTKSGKITELAVRELVHGREIKNRDALANPEALDLFRDLPVLQY